MSSGNPATGLVHYQNKDWTLAEIKQHIQRIQSLSDRYQAVREVSDIYWGQHLKTGDILENWFSFVEHDPARGHCGTPILKIEYIKPIIISYSRH